MIRDVAVKDAGKKGKGVFALKDFGKSDFIFRSKRGRLISRKSFGKLSREDQRHLNEIDENTFEIMTPPARYVNHSCNPNAIMKGRSYFALKQIKKGEEITTDYRINGLFKNKWKCHCRSKNCKGWVVSDFFTLSEKLQRKYLPYTIKSIREEYKRHHRK